ncbi:MAG: spore coat protein CotH, partial [Oscillibacter sp.]|nr:spore coat protein CotH [Oscillibacter sp.]
LIAPYVERDPTKFCTYEEFVKGVETLRAFCELRTQSVRGQLDGSIPATDDGQSADSSALIDASALTLSDMGNMNRGGAFGGRFGRTADGQTSERPSNGQTSGRMPGGQTSERTADEQTPNANTQQP